MARGRASQVGDTNVSANGYHYTRTEEGWRLTHHIIAEQKYGRPIGPGEQVIFVDGKRKNLDPSNIEVREVGRGSLRRKRSQLQARIDELAAQLREVDEALAGKFGKDEWQGVNEVESFEQPKT